MNATPWTCPACRRTFGRRGQSHECAPAITLEEYFSTGPERERPIFEAVMAHLDDISNGDLVVEPVSVGIFIKRGKGFVELRPKVRWVAMSFPLSSRLDHPRIARVMPTSTKFFHVVNLRDASDVDDVVRSWLTRAYAELDG